MNDIFNRVRKFIIQGNLILENDIVGCAISGGSDSIFMTVVLNEISKNMNFKIIGIHVNHMLRGKRSYEDENFVVDFCKNINIDCRVYRKDVNQYSKDNKISLEMAGREIRYEIFKKLKEDKVITKCSLGHHADDDVETIIMRIFKGTGLKGMEGIKEIRDNFYIRPILFLRKTLEIEPFLKSNNINFMLDESNLNDYHLRNKVRLSVLPYMNQKFSMDVVGSVLSLKEMCKYDNDFFEGLVNKYVLEYVEIFEDKVFVCKKCFDLHEALLYRVIKKAIQPLIRGTNVIGLKSIKYICSISNKKQGKRIQIRKDLFCINKQDYLLFSKNLEQEATIIKFCFQELLNEKDIYDLKNRIQDKFVKEINFLNKKLKIIIVTENGFIKDKYKETNSKYFSLDNVENSVCIRNRRYGDVFKPFGMKNNKKLKDFLINNKARNKNEIPLICFDNNIAWVVGFRNSDDYRVLEDSKLIVKIELHSL